ncbi:MAG: helix-turn-helix transcriptional regulator, partial [Actinomycetota bacterium]
MRAGRLITLVLILQRHGRVTAAELARRLEVSERTVLRDIEALSGAGVPVYATRGAGGGFELLERRTPELAGVSQWRPGERRPGR